MRPRLCVVCRAPATWANEIPRRAASLKRDGRILRFTELVRTFYCDEHIGSAP